MNYKHIYKSFIEDRINKQEFSGYSEKHHILPKSIGGADNKENLIRLTAKDHFFAHRLLAKIYKGKMIFAFSMMLKTRGKGLATRHTYEALKIEIAKELSTLHKGVPTSDETKAKMSKAGKGKKHSKEWNDTVSRGQKGKVLTKEHKEKISKSTKGVKKPKGHGEKIAAFNRTRVFTDEHRENISKSLKGGKLSDVTRQRMREAVRKPRVNVDVECPHCGLVGKGGNMTRYHFNNCKALML